MCLSTVYLFGLRDFEEPETAMPPICKVNQKIYFSSVSCLRWERGQKYSDRLGFEP